MAVEFTSTSISSGGDGQDLSPNDQAVMGANASLKFVNRQRGFMLCDVTKDRWETSVHVLDKVSAADGAISRRARIQVAPGSSRLIIG